MYLGNSLNIKANLAKPITDKLDVGLGVNVGFLFGDFDWALSANVGALYRIGDLGFLKDFRIGASVSNLGKVFTNTNSIRPVKFGTENLQRKNWRKFLLDRLYVFRNAQLPNWR